MAIWVTPKLSSLPDVGISSPQDGHVLTYDSGTGEGVNEAPVAGVTDHGALTGLADDDHTGYLLATGSRTGASSAAQPFTVGISLADTTTATTGVIFKSGTPWAHNFHHPTGDTAIPVGGNIFIGGAGNFTMGSTATNIAHGSYNVAIGSVGLAANTTGARNVAIGGSLNANTTGYENMSIGSNSMMACTTGYVNTAVGSLSLRFLTTGNLNTSIGGSSAYSITTGNGNVCIGYSAARYQSDGTTSLTDPENSVYIGYAVRGFDNTDINAIVIGYNAIGTGANTTVIGNTSTKANTLYGAGKFWLRSAATNAVTTIGTLTHNSSGTPAAGLGAGPLFQVESTNTEDPEAARDSAVWSDATHATRTADIVFSTVVGAAALAEKLRLTGAGILKFSGTMGDSTKTVGTDAPADWLEIQVGANTYYAPLYAAS